MKALIPQEVIMPITPEQAIALTDSENELLQKTFKDIDLKLSLEYDYDVELEIDIPEMRHTMVNLIVKTYEGLGWHVYNDGEWGLTFSSDLTEEVVPYNKPSGHPYR